MYLFMYICLSACLYVLSMRSCSAGIQTYKHKYTHTKRQAYLNAYINTSGPPYRHTYIVIHTYIHAYTHTYIHTFIHTSSHTYMHAYIHTYINTDRANKSNNTTIAKSTSWKTPNRRSALFGKPKIAKRALSGKPFSPRIGKSIQQPPLREPLRS